MQLSDEDDMAVATPDMNSSLVVLRSVGEKNLDDVIHEILQRCQWQEIVRPGARIVIKPNIGAAQREYLQSNTSLPVIESVCRHLLNRTSYVVIGEADGMRHTAEQALEAMGVYEMGKTLGVKVISLSRDRLVDVPNSTLGSWKLPQTLLEADVFISMPILKTHARTVITGAIKNLWGCIPQYDRVVLHKHLNRLLVDLIELCKPRLAIMDAVVAMEGRGPNNGKLVRLDLLLGSRDLVALDATAMRLVGFDPHTSKVCVLAASEGHGQIDRDSIVVDGDLEEYKISFKPSEMDWFTRLFDLVTRSHFLTHHMIFNKRIFKICKIIVSAAREVQQIGQRRWSKRAAL